MALGHAVLRLYEDYASKNVGDHSGSYMYSPPQVDRIWHMALGIS